jgi:hypothetical protein
MKTIEEVRAALSECERHASILRAARTEIGDKRFSPDTVENLGGELVKSLDQSAYRFGKLQDTLGMRVLPGILELAEEPLPEATPFAEKLQRLERLAVIPSVNQWRRLRELRNQLAHEYVDAPHLKAATLNRFVDGITEALEVWRHISSFAKSKGWYER